MIWNDASEDKDGVLNFKLSYNNLPVEQPVTTKASSAKDQELLKKRKRVIEDED